MIFKILKNILKNKEVETIPQKDIESEILLCEKNGFLGWGIKIKNNGWHKIILSLELDYVRNEKELIHPTIKRNYLGVLQGEGIVFESNGEVKIDSGKSKIFLLTQIVEDNPFFITFPENDRDIYFSKDGLYQIVRLTVRGGLIEEDTITPLPLGQMEIKVYNDGSISSFEKESFRKINIEKYIDIE